MKPIVRIASFLALTFLGPAALIWTAEAVRVDQEIPGYKPAQGVSGSLKSVGSDTMNNEMTLWAEGFRRFYPNVKIEIEGKGSSTAPPALTEGTAQFGPMSREMKAEEKDQFEKGRDQGVQLWGQTPKGTIDWRGGLFNGNGRNTQVNDNSHYQFDARVTWQPFGDVKYSESDFESTTRPLVAVAAQFEANDNHDRIDATDQVNRTVYGGDIVFKFKGVSVFGEYYHRVNEPELSEEFRTDGYTGQIGVFVFRRYVELAVRYATVRGKDSPLAIVTARKNDRLERGAALNWFMNKHNLKLQADYRRIENEALDVTNDEYRLQMQFIF